MKKTIFYSIAILTIVWQFIGCSREQVNQQTLENLKKSLVREISTRETYKAYTNQAEKEHLHQVARLFKALSIGENVHASNYINLLKSLDQDITSIDPFIVLDSTRFNLQNSIKEELFEIDSVYPVLLMGKFPSQTEKKISDVYRHTWEAEKSHKSLLLMIYDFFVSEAPKNIEKSEATLPSQNYLQKLDSDFLEKVYYVCPVDGKIFDSQNVPESCNICKTPKSKLIKVE